MSKTDKQPEEETLPRNDKGSSATSCSHFVEWLESKAEEYNQIERGYEQWNLDRDNYRRMAWAMRFVKETFLNENAK